MYNMLQKLIKYILSINMIVLFYHLVVCSVATFIQWEPMYFNINTWSVAGRGFYFAGLLFSVVAVMAIAHEGNGKRNEQT